MTRASLKDLQRAIDFLERANDLAPQRDVPPQIDYAALAALAEEHGIELDAEAIEQGFRLLMQARLVVA